MPDDFRVSITDQPGPDAWPIATFTYILIYRDMPDAKKGAALLHFLWWAEHDGQKLAAPLDYAPLPPPVVHKVEQTLREIKVEGKAVLAARK
jgi:phosphate transport system substrate-binding protein